MCGNSVNKTKVRGTRGAWCAFAVGETSVVGKVDHHSLSMKAYATDCEGVREEREGVPADSVDPLEYHNGSVGRIGGRCIRLTVVSTPGWCASPRARSVPIPVSRCVTF